MPELTPPDQIPKPRVHVRVNWDKRADGQWRTFYQDTDFPNSRPKAFYDAASKYARRHGLGFSGRVHSDRVLIQLWKKEPIDDQRDATGQPTLE